MAAKKTAKKRPAKKTATKRPAKKTTAKRSAKKHGAVKYVTLREFSVRVLEPGAKKPRYVRVIDPTAAKARKSVLAIAQLRGETWKILKVKRLAWSSKILAR
jgi:hypothetical protein